MVQCCEMQGWLWYGVKPGPAPRGPFRGRAPPNDCLCPPLTKIVAPKQGLRPEEIYRLGAIGMEIEAKDFQIGVYRPYFRSFCGLTPDFIKVSGQKPFSFSFFFFFGLRLRIREKLQEF